jgi:Predicted nucleotide-binding protein containing TIR-like domain/Ricin-type beta-trefoil lectin domain-like
MRSIVFIASSSESKYIADAIKKNLEDCADVRVWDESFELSVPIIDGLFNNLRQADFGIFILSADDALRIREKDYLGGRDNVIFELGLFMGRMGRERAFFLVPRNLPADKEFRIPSDLHGLVYPTFDPNETAQVATQAACQQIRRQIERLAGRRLYHVTNKNSGKCLDVEAWRRKPGAGIVQWSYHGGTNQLWRLERAEDRFYYIRSDHSDLYLTAPEANNGPQIQQQELGRNGDRQQWEFISLPGETYRVTPRFDDELCLAVESESTENGADIVVSKWKHQAPYEWWLNIKATLDASRW